jgi:shikimate kinase
MTQGPIPIRRLVCLSGFMGCGKTTVGRLLSRRLGWSFVDLDEELERRQGRTIRQIFEQEGEPFFRRIESDLLEEILARGQTESLVAALGGGTVTQPDALERIHATGAVTIWLDCPLEELRRRCRGLTHRPLFRDPESFQQLFEQRLPFYRQADFRVDANRSHPEDVVEEILQCGVF